MTGVEVIVALVLTLLILIALALCIGRVGEPVREYIQDYLDDKWDEGYVEQGLPPVRGASTESLLFMVDNYDVVIQKLQGEYEENWIRSEGTDWAKNDRLLKRIKLTMYLKRHVVKELRRRGVHV